MKRAKLFLGIAAVMLAAFPLSDASAQDITKFSIRRTLIKSYPDIVLKGGIDLDKDGILSEEEQLIDDNEDGKFDEREFWNFFQENKDSISRKVISQVEAVKDIAKSNIEAGCYGNTKCVIICLRVLSAMKDKSNIPTFLKEVGSYDGEVRQSAVEALGNTGDKSVVGMLLEVMKSDERAKTRGAAITSLSKICDKSDKQVAAEIRMALSDDNRAVVKYAATRALAKIGDENAIPELRVALTSKNEKVRRGAATALGNIGNNMVVQDLIKALRDEDSKVRKNAAEALGKIGDISAKAALEDASKDIDPEVAQVASAALVQLQEKEIARQEEEKKKAEEDKKDKTDKAEVEKDETKKGLFQKLGCSCDFVY